MITAGNLNNPHFHKKSRVKKGKEEVDEEIKENREIYSPPVGVLNVCQIHLPNENIHVERPSTEGKEGSAEDEDDERILPPQVSISKCTTNQRTRHRSYPEGTTKNTLVLC